LVFTNHTSPATGLVGAAPVGILNEDAEVVLAAKVTLPGNVTVEVNAMVTAPVDADTLIWFAVPASEVTPVLLIVIVPTPLVTEIPVVVAKVAKANAVPLPINNWPLEGTVDTVAAGAKPTIKSDKTSDLKVGEAAEPELGPPKIKLAAIVPKISRLAAAEILP